MRVNLTKARKVNAGDLVRIRLALPAGIDYARLSVWSRVGEHEFSPHTQNAKIMAVKDGRPQFLSPMYVQLNEFRRKHTIEFIAEETSDFIVKQETDLADEAQADARIIRYGKYAQAAQALGRRLRNAFRSLRRGPKVYVGDR